MEFVLENLRIIKTEQSRCGELLTDRCAGGNDEGMAGVPFTAHWQCHSSSVVVVAVADAP